MTTTRYLEIIARQRPFPFALDERERVMFSANYDCLAASPVNKFEENLVSLFSGSNIAVLGVDTFIGRKVVVPDGAGPFISIIDTGGRQPERTQTGEVYERLSAQVVVRATGYAAARSRALAIWRILDGQRNISVTDP